MPFKFEKQGDAFGWNRQADGRLFLGLFVETGRIKDREGWRLKTALREIVAKYQPEIRLTPGNNVILANLEATQREEITRLFAEHGMQTEAERQGSALAPRLDGVCIAAHVRPGFGGVGALPAGPDYAHRGGCWRRLGLSGQEITIRMTGCPNGCARPYMAEIRFRRQGPGTLPGLARRQ